MDSIESTFLRGATVACMILAFSATVVIGAKFLSPLADLIGQSHRQQDPDVRQTALFLMGLISGILAIVIVVIKLDELGKSDLDVTWRMINSVVAQRCAETLVALGLLRLVLAALFLART